MPPPLNSHVPVAGLNKNRARSQSHPQRRPRAYTHICNVKNAADYAEKLKTLTTMQIDSQSERHLEPSRSISTTIQTDAFLQQKTIIASNACAFRVNTNQFLRFNKNASGRNSDFTHRLRNSSTVVNSIASTIAIQRQYATSYLHNPNNPFLRQSIFPPFSAIRSVSSLLRLLLKPRLEMNLSRRP